MGLMRLRATVGGRTFTFSGLRDVLAKASPERSGDELAGIAASSPLERAAAQWCLADVSLTDLIAQPLIPYEDDEVTRLILDTHDPVAFAPIAHMTVGELRDHLLATTTDTAALATLARGLTPEIVAAVIKLMRNQDLIVVAAKCSVTTAFRDTIGLPGRLSSRIQPNHPTDDPTGIAVAILDGLTYGCGDACIGINPATDSVAHTATLLRILSDVIERFEIPTQSCVLAHVTTTLAAMQAGAPVDLVFQSIAGTQAANRAFGIDLALLGDAQATALALGRGTVGDNVMYFETGQGSALSAEAHHGVDQATLESRAYGVARAFAPLLVNSVVGFIGPEYLLDGKQIRRAGLEDHCSGKLLGLPMGMDVCLTNHADADQNDSDDLMALLTAAGCTFFMGVPGADDVMLEYQSTSFHDVATMQRLFDRRPAPEFAAWLEAIGLTDSGGQLQELMPGHPLLAVTAT